MNRFGSFTGTETHDEIETLTPANKVNIQSMFGSRFQNFVSTESMNIVTSSEHRQDI